MQSFHNYFADLKIKKTRGSQNESGKNKSCLKNGKPKKKVAIAASSNYSQLPIERSIIFTAEKNKPQVDVKVYKIIFYLNILYYEIKMRYIFNYSS